MGEAVVFSASDARGFTSGASELHLSRDTSGASAASSGVNEGMVDAESLYLCRPATTSASIRDHSHKIPHVHSCEQSDVDNTMLSPVDQHRCRWRATLHCYTPTTCIRYSKAHLPADGNVLPYQQKPNL